VTGLVKGDSLANALSGGASFTASGRNAGSYALNESQSTLTSDFGYGINFGTGTLTINPEAITVTASGATKTYDGTTSVGAGVTPTVTSGMVFKGDTANFTEAFDSRNAGSRMLVASGSVSDGTTNGGNYMITFANGAGTIDKAALTVSAVAGTKVYDGTTSSGGVAQVTGLIGSDTASGFTQAFGSKNVQGQNGSLLLVNQASGLVNDGNGGGNYAVTFMNATGTIDKAALTVSAVADRKVYDGTTSSGGMTQVTGLIGSDTASGFTQAFGSKNAQGQNGSVLLVNQGSGVVNDGNGGGNYAVTFMNATGTITKAALTVTEVAGSKVFDGTTGSSASAQVSGLKGSDTASGLAESFASANAGNQAMTSGGLTVNDGNGGGNYAITIVNATGTITPAPLTITANNATQVFGTPDPVFSASFGPFPAGLGPSALSGTLSFTANTAGSTPGSFQIIPGGLSSPNFDITFVPGTLLVTAANNTLPPVPFEMDQGNGAPAFSFIDPVLASLVVQFANLGGSQNANGGSAIVGNLQTPKLDEAGQTLGNLIGFNSSFIEVCRTHANLCR
ncbi:MAG: hypothetical protein JO068_07665, partial [Hyphomicrobiales bacterium]|nr:hypothetical protein [Hyphomicrobiales bacterium]